MQLTEQNTRPQATNARVTLFDGARGVAMIAMTVFHFTWDLEYFGYAPAGLTSQFEWKLFARIIAASFLIIAGMSLMLAHGHGIRWALFRKRTGLVIGAALIISAATYFTTPDRFVFFGILHQIAAASMIGLMFLRLPPAVILTAGLVVLILPYVFRAELFEVPYFYWSGLAPFDPPSNDYVPVFPWTGYFLIGIALAKIGVRTGIISKLATLNATKSRAGAALALLGRNGLFYYLIHQPIMIAALYGITLLVPPAPIDKAALFGTQCVKGCVPERDTLFCERFCGCIRTQLEAASIFRQVIEGDKQVDTNPQILEISRNCSQRKE